MSEPAPIFVGSKFSIGELCALFRLIDILEEQSCVFHARLEITEGKCSPAAESMVDLQEYLSNQRGEIVEELQGRPHRDDDDGKLRLSLLLQYQAWCREFERQTVDEFANSAFAKEAQ